MTGQCWLKHQDDPNNPQVNMRGDYSAAYLKRHPGAPQSVRGRNPLEPTQAPTRPSSHHPVGLPLRRRCSGKR
eukprot:669299-Prymnesium_polylepis.1